MTPNIHETNIFMNFGNTLCIMKILDSNILILHNVFSITGFVALHGLNSSLPSPNGGLSCTVLSSFIVAANQESLSNPALSATQRGTYAILTPKTVEIMLFCMEQVLLHDTPRNNFTNWNSRVYVAAVTWW